MPPRKDFAVYRNKDFENRLGQKLDISKKEAERVRIACVETILELLQEGLSQKTADGVKIVFSGFGSLAVKYSAPKSVLIPRTRLKKLSNPGVRTTFRISRASAVPRLVESYTKKDSH